MRPRFRECSAGYSLPAAAVDDREPAPLRILLLNYEYPPLGGGAGVATAELAQRLATRGAMVDVLTADAGTCDVHPRAVDRARDDTHPCAPGLTVHRVRVRRRGIHQAGWGGAGSYLRAALPTLRRLVRTRRYQLVHCFFSLPTGLLLPAAALDGVPSVVSLRGSDVPGYDRSNVTLQHAHRLLRPVTRWIWRRASRVVAVCEALGQLARRTDPRLEYSVIPNGVDLDRFHPAAPSSPHRGPVRCIAVARLTARKGIGELLEAWPLLERGRFHLEVIGRGGEEERWRRTAAALGCASEITFSGALTHERLADHYRAADIFTLAPYDEAFGNVFAEALASGLPIVGSDVGGIPELVRSGENGILVPPGDPPALAAAITRLGADAGARRAISVRNRARAEALLSWERNADRYLDLYATLLAETTAPAPHAPLGSSR